MQIPSLIKNHPQAGNYKDRCRSDRYGVALLFLTVFCLVLMPKAAFSGKIAVFVSIVPQQYFVQQIGGELVDVRTMAEPGASPATYEPKPKQMAALAQTRIYYAIGVPFEKVWLHRITAANPNMKVVHTDDGVQKIPMQAHRRHAKDDRHQDGILDPHIWTSPRLGKIQADHILNALVQIDPGHKAVYQANYEKFVKKIEEIDAEFKRIFAGKKGTEFIVFHPSWGYFAQDYGLKQVAIEIEGKKPKPARLKELIEHAVKRRINVIFVQPQFSTKSAQTVAKAIGGQVVFADPLALNWEDNLRQLAAKFKTALK